MDFPCYSAGGRAPKVSTKTPQGPVLSTQLCWDMGLGTLLGQGGPVGGLSLSGCCELVLEEPMGCPQS